MHNPLRIPLILSALLFGVLTVSCEKEETPSDRREPPAVAEQTVIMYLAGTDLRSYFENNIEQAKAAVATGEMLYDSRLLVFVQPSSTEASVIELYYDQATRRCATDTLQRWEGESFISASGENIAQVLTFVVNEAPAKHYGLIMGSHATGWVPSGHVSIANHADSDPYWQTAEGALPTRWFGRDKGQATDITTLAAVLEELRETTVEFDYLMFDACFMSSIEALYDLRHAVEYIVASPTEIMATGFPYRTLLPCLFTEQGTGYDLAAACRAFYDYYNQSSIPSGCITLTRTAHLDALAEAYRRIRQGTLKSYSSSSLQSYEGLSPHLFYDLGDFATAVCDDPAALEAFNTQMELAFPAESRFHTPLFYSAYNGRMNTIRPDLEPCYGVSVSEPSTKFSPENRQTAWYLATH